MLVLAYMSSTTAAKDLALSRAAPPWIKGTFLVDTLLVIMGPVVVTITFHDSTYNGILDRVNPYDQDKQFWHLITVKLWACFGGLYW